MNNYYLNLLPLVLTRAKKKNQKLHSFQNKSSYFWQNEEKEKNDWVLHDKLGWSEVIFDINKEENLLTNQQIIIIRIVGRRTFHQIARIASAINRLSTMQK
jgi:hypothetical protein